MGNVFTRSNDATPKPNRNTFDGSFVNNLTLKMGQITPCFLKEVIPGDSFKIDATFGFNFQPFVFPVQTDMQANLHFFYVRNRALWNGWQDFITKTENLDGDSTPPYVLLTAENRDMFNTGMIGDFLGVPTVVYGNQVRTYTDYLQNSPVASTDGAVIDSLYLHLVLGSRGNDTGVVSSYSFASNPESYFDGTSFVTVEILDSFARTTPNVFKYSELQLSNQFLYLPLYYGQIHQNTTIMRWPSNVWADNIKDLYWNSGVAPYPADDFDPLDIYALSTWYDKTDSRLLAAVMHHVVTSHDSGDEYTYVEDIDGDSVIVLYGGDNVVIGVNTDGKGYRDVMINFEAMGVSGDEVVQKTILLKSVPRGKGGRVLFERTNSFQYVSLAGGLENSDVPLSELPFASMDNSDGLRISALPFRAVEACYNAFYRDDRNNPLIIDGKPYYNVYVQNKRGGADTTHYKLYQRNWESDVFTSAVQSPQQGIAPLVGVTASGQMTFADEEGKTYYLQAEFGEDGHTITGIKSYSSDMPVGTLRAMVDTISTGISINDFRNVNALQRWLETNMRKGLRYKDQIEAHFGTAPTYSELDMPEFIGGMSRRVEVNKVVQTSADTPESPMGTLAGNASILGGNGQSVTQYCDEHGWIIGFITITPKPVYSQQLNKQLLKNELLDYYFPEFAHIGFQPILNQEIAPLQCRDQEGDRLTDVFGYQRAWYEYLANVDEVHGDFRTTLKDYIIHRVFDGVPKLGVDFLTVSQDEANEVFAVQDDSDKIFGQIYFDVKMKRPLPAIGVPKLEVG